MWARIPLVTRCEWVPVSTGVSAGMFRAIAGELLSRPLEWLHSLPQGPRPYVENVGRVSLRILCYCCIDFKK